MNLSRGTHNISYTDKREMSFSQKISYSKPNPVVDSPNEIKETRKIGDSVKITMNLMTEFIF